MTSNGLPSARLEDLTFEEAGAYLENDDRLVLPFGSVEQNGRHLPLGTDLLVSRAIAERAAERAGALVGPGIPWGSSDPDLGYPGTISLPVGVLSPLVEELCAALGQQGFRRLVIVTGHLYNTWSVASVAGSLQRRGVAIVQVDMWRLAAKLGADVLTSERSFGHADEVCTSMVMALVPDAVRRDRVEAVEPTPGWAWDTYASYPEVMGFSAWEEVSAGGTVGDPSQASTEKGEVLIERTVEHVCELVRRISEARLRDEPKP